MVIVQDDPSGLSESAVLYLQGGRGGSARLGREFRWHLWAADAGLGQDLVLYDQRGTGLSDPSLICEELRLLTRRALELGRFSDRVIDLSIDAIVDCNRRLAAEGHDLKQFSTLQNASDVVALMDSLPYANWTLFGVSYGSRLALEVMRMRPERVKSVVLDGVLPPDLNLFLEHTANMDEAIAKIAGVCSLSRTERQNCVRSASDFNVALDAVLERVAESPHRVIVEAGVLDDGPSVNILVDAPVLLSVLYEATAMPDGTNMARYAIPEAARGNHEMLDYLVTVWAYFQFNIGIHKPVYFSVLCDLDGDWTEEDFYRRASTTHYMRTHFPGSSSINPCGYWTSSRAAPETREPITSSIPTLLLSGEFDSLTPSSWGDRVLAGLENGYHFTIPQGGHVSSMRDRCAMGIMAAFLSDPTVRPDSPCLDEMMPGRWPE